MLNILDLDFLILSYFDRQSISNMIINKYSTSILNNQEFWKFRLENRLQLTSNVRDIDYRSVTKLLDYDKSLYDHYCKSNKTISDQLTKLLKLDGNPVYLLTSVHVDLIDLRTNCDTPYDEFIERIIAISNTYGPTWIDGLISTIDIDRLSKWGRSLINVTANVAHKPDKLTFDLCSSYFDLIAFKGKTIEIIIPVVPKQDWIEDSDNEASEDDSYNDPASGFKIIKIINERDSLTNGQLLYKLANLIPQRVSTVRNYGSEDTFDGLYYHNGQYDVLNYIYELTSGSLYH